MDIDDLKKMAHNMKGKFSQLSDDCAHTTSVKLNADVFEKTKNELEGGLT